MVDVPLTLRPETGKYGLLGPPGGARDGYARETHELASPLHVPVSNGLFHALGRSLHVFAYLGMRRHQGARLQRHCLRTVGSIRPTVYASWLSPCYPWQIMG